MRLTNESPQELIERIAGLTAIAERHGVTMDVLVPYRETLLMIVSRSGIRATVEAKHLGESFSLTLHESNPRGASGSDFEGVIKVFCEMEEAISHTHTNIAAGDDQQPGPKSTSAPKG